MSERAARLRRAATGLYAACLRHPFVRGIGDGSLPPGVFTRWVVQDWAYLVAYIEVMQGLSERAPTLEARRRWGDLAALSRDEELQLHRAFAARFDLDPAELEAPPWQQTVAYTDFLMASVATGYGVGVAAVVPCGVDYVDVAEKLARAGLPDEPRYADWVTGYTAPAFVDAVAWMEAELDAVEGDEAELEAAYLAGAAHELAFWDQLWG